MNQENQGNHNEIKERFTDLVPRKLKLIENIKKIGTIRLLLTQDELTVNQTSVILEAIHRMLPDEVRILRDNGHGGWVCVRVTDGPEARRVKKVFVYSSHKGFDKHKFGENDQPIINDLFGTPDWIPSASYPNCFRAARRQDEFLFVLAYALCIAMGQAVSSFTILIDGNDGPTEDVRRIIVDLLLDGAITLNASVRDIWQRS